jgi:hypothetical protein
MNLTLFQPRSKNVPTHTSQPQTMLVRRFVETYDERCPLAGLWTTLVQSDTATDDPELARPVMRSLLSWRLFHRPLTYLSYRLI